MQLKQNGRAIEVTAINHGASDPVDSFIESAEYTGRLSWLWNLLFPLTEERLNRLADDNADKIYSDWTEEQICRAEYLSEGDR